MFFNDYKLHIDLNWYKGETFRVFSLDIWESMRDVGMIVVFDIQISKLGFSINLIKD